MPLYRMYPLRKHSYYACMELWTAFGMTGNNSFNFMDAERVVGRNCSGYLKAMKSANVTQVVNGENRTRHQYTKDGPKQWVFSHKFCKYMQSAEGQEELAIAMEFVHKQRQQSKEGDKACA